VELNGYILGNVDFVTWRYIS